MRRLVLASALVLPSVLVSFFVSLPAAGLAGTWQQSLLPFENAVVTVMAAAPSQTGRVYAGLTGYGVVRTDDRGLTWTASGAGLPDDVRPTALDVAVFDPSLVLVGTQAGGLFRSTDAGANWTDVSPAAPDARNVTDIVIHEGAAPFVHAVFASGDDGGIYRSTDGGTTWALNSLGPLPARSLAAQPGNPSVMLAGVADGITRSTDGGLTWQPTAATSWYTELVFSLADPTLVIGVEAGDLWRSGDAGETFTELAPLPDEWGGPGVVACHPTDADLLVAAGSGYGCNPINGSFPYGWRSTDRGDTWVTTDVTTSCDAGHHSAVAFDPVAPSYLYRGTRGREGRGFAVSTSTGSTWDTRVSGLQNYSVSTVRGDEAGTTYALLGDTFFRRAASPDTWTARGEGIGPGHVSEGLEVNITNPDVLHEVGYFGTELLEQFAMRSNDGALTWDGFWVAGLPPGQATLWSNHGGGQHVYACSYGELYRSDDGHQSYALVSTDVHFSAQIVVDPGDWQRLFATGAEGSVVALSTDGGATFTPRDAGLPVVSPWHVLALFMRRTDPDFLSIVLENGTVWETEDAGISWSLRFSFPTDFYDYGVDATWDPASGHVFVSVPRTGIFTAHPDHDPSGLPTDDVNAVHFSPGLGTLFAATAMRGVWTQSLAPPTSVGPGPRVAGATLHVAPNPFSERTTFALRGRAGRGAVVRIVDVTGRLVRRLELGDAPTAWDGTDTRGRPVPAGVYFLRVDGAGADTRRVVRLR